MKFKNADRFGNHHKPTRTTETTGAKLIKEETRMESTKMIAVAVVFAVCSFTTSSATGKYIFSVGMKSAYNISCINMLALKTKKVLRDRSAFNFEEGLDSKVHCLGIRVNVINTWVIL